MLKYYNTVMSDIAAGRNISSYRKALDDAYNSGLVVISDGEVLITAFSASKRKRRLVR